MTPTLDPSVDPRNQEVVFAAGRDPQVGNLETPVNASGIVKWFIGNLPAYREGLTPLRRGLEVGMAHGYLLYGPFSKLGPLRDAENGNLAGLLGTIGLVVILTACLSLYANAMPKPAIKSVTAANPADAFTSRETWNSFGSGFFIGGLGGAVFAYFLVTNLGLFQGMMN